LIEEYTAGSESLEQVFATMARQKGINDRVRRLEKRTWNKEELEAWLKSSQK
jgi:hypothetical protein